MLQGLDMLKYSTCLIHYDFYKHTLTYTLLSWLRGEAKSSCQYTGLQACNITALHFCGEQSHSQLTIIVTNSQVSFVVKNKYVTDAVGLDLGNKITWSVMEKDDIVCVLQF